MITLPNNRTDLSGQRYSALVCLHPVEIKKNSHIMYVCRCDCGNEKTISSSNLRSGHTQSCGCLLANVVSATNKSHSKSRTRIYRVWTQMMQRCYKEYAPNYKWYGGSGVTVDPAWHSFEQFYADMGDPPPGMTLERKRHDGPYSMENCRWATRQEQAENKRNSVHITYRGETKTLTAWERELGVRKDFFGKRLRRGLSVEQAFEIQNRRAI